MPVGHGLEILRFVPRGLSNAEIADRLFISVKTAGNHVSNILPKIAATPPSPQPTS